MHAYFPVDSTTTDVPNQPACLTLILLQPQISPPGHVETLTRQFTACLVELYHEYQELPEHGILIASETCTASQKRMGSGLERHWGIIIESRRVHGARSRAQCHLGDG